MRKNPYKLAHQKVSLHIDLFKRSLVGFVELTVQPTTAGKRLETVALNSRCSEIQSATVNGVSANWRAKNFLDQVVETTYGKTDEESFKTFYKAGLQASDSGELVIDIPQEIPSQMDMDSSSVLLIKINYRLVAPKSGAYFVLPSEVYPKRRAHMYVHNATTDARNWMPCFDNLTDRPTWEMEYTVSAEEKDLVVVSSGDLMRTVLSEDETLKTFYFRNDVPSAARSILLAAGPFEILPDEVGFDASISVTHFCLPGRKNLLRHTVQFLAGAYKFFNNYLSTDLPYKSYKQVFVEESYSKLCIGASMCIFSTNVLHPPEVIDDTFETRRLLSLGLIQQWFGAFISIKEWPDSWIQFGLAGFMMWLYFRQMFGNNEFKFRLVNDMEYVCYSPENQALYCTNYVSPSEFYNKLFFRKSVLVMYLMERKLGTDGFKKVLSSLLTPTKSSNNLPTYLSISTEMFLKFVKKLTGFDMKEFAEKWVYTTGCPHFTCGFWFDKIRFQTEVAIKQHVDKSKPKISGTLNVRIVEMDQEEQHRYFQHPLPIEEEAHVFEFPCHSRPRRPRSGQPAGPGYPEPPFLSSGKKDEDSDDENNPVSMVEIQNTTPVQWLRFDPHLDWVMTVSFRQPQFMWINQLQHDKDVASQLQAIRQLQLYPNKDTIDSLNWVLSHPNLYFRVRMRAALTMAFLTNASNNWVGLDHLFKFFKTNFFYGDPVQVKPNDFENFSNYFQQKAVAFALSLIRGQDGKTPSDVIDFLVHLLKNNDNSHNPWSDSYYLTALLHALANLSTSSTNTVTHHTKLPLQGGMLHPTVSKPVPSLTKLPLDSKIEKLIERYLNMEKMMPSYKNTITCACLTAFCHLQRLGYLNKNIPMFKQYFKYGNYLDVRITALRAIIALNLGNGLYRHQGSMDDDDTTTILSHQQQQQQQANPFAAEPHNTMHYLLNNCLDEEPSIWMRYKIVSTLIEPRDILSATAKMWDLADHFVQDLLLTDAASGSSGSASTTTATTTPTPTVTQPGSDDEHSHNKGVFPKAVLEIGAKIVKHRFRKFQLDTVPNLALRTLVWNLLNSGKTAQDARLRMALVRLYKLIGGENSIESKLPPRPVLPTFPINKKKLKKEKQKKEQEQESKKRKREGEEESGKDGEDSAKRQKTNGEVAVRITAPLKAKVKIPTKASQSALVDEDTKQDLFREKKKVKSEGDTEKKKKPKERKKKREIDDTEDTDYQVDAPATAESYTRGDEDDEPVLSDEEEDEEWERPQKKHKRLKTLSQAASNGQESSRPPRRNAAMIAEAATAKHVTLDEDTMLLYSTEQQIPPAPVTETYYTTEQAADSSTSYYQPPITQSQDTVIESVKSTKVKIKLRNPAASGPSPVSPPATTVSPHSPYNAPGYDTSKLPASPVAASPPPRPQIPTAPVFPNLKRIVALCSGFDPRYDYGQQQYTNNDTYNYEDDMVDVETGTDQPEYYEQQAQFNQLEPQPEPKIVQQPVEPPPPETPSASTTTQSTLPKIKIKFTKKS